MGGAALPDCSASPKTLECKFPLMQSRGGGHIINVASVVGRAFDPEISSQSDQERVADHSGGAVSGTWELLRHQMAGVFGNPTRVVLPSRITIYGGQRILDSLWRRQWSAIHFPATSK